MSRTLTSKCDGCGIEHVDDGEEGMGVASILGAGRRRGTDRWGSLSVASSGFPAMFDLCEGCTKRVVALLELEIPDTRAAVQRYSGLGGHAMPFMPGDFMAPPSAPPWSKPGLGLTPEDLRALGLGVPDVSPLSDEWVFECPTCQVMRGAPNPGSICGNCGHRDP